MTPLAIVAVGHTDWKMARLCAILPTDALAVRVFNGEQPFEGAIHRLTNAGRDVGMYRAGLDALGCDRAAFLNDDVEHVSPDFWTQAREFCRGEDAAQIVGVANLLSWVDLGKCKGATLRRALADSRVPRFIRTSAFLATRAAFDQLWTLCRGSAQRFEKSTLQVTPHRFMQPIAFWDSNVAPFIKPT